MEDLEARATDFDMEFDIEKVKNGAKVITADGDKVRILATDIPGIYPVAAYVERLGESFGSVYQFAQDGRPQHPHEVQKLVITKAKKKGWINIFCNKSNGDRWVHSMIYNSYEEAKNKVSYLQEDYYISTVEVAWYQ